MEADCGLLKRQTGNRRDETIAGSAAGFGQAAIGSTASRFKIGLGGFNLIQFARTRSPSWHRMRDERRIRRP
jgi:hypothetical protein